MAKKAFKSESDIKSITVLQPYEARRKAINFNSKLEKQIEFAKIRLVKSY